MKRHTPMDIYRRREEIWEISASAKKTSKTEKMAPHKTMELFTSNLRQQLYGAIKEQSGTVPAASYNDI